MLSFSDTGLVVLDLVNTWDPLLPEPERLTDPSALDRFLVDVGETASGGTGAEDLDAVRDLRGRLRDLISTPVEARADRLVELAAALPFRVSIRVSHGVPALEIEAPSGAPAATMLAARSVVELVGLAERGEWDRVRQCAADPCQDAYVDRTRNRTRRFCCVRCSNRFHAAAARARHRAERGAAGRPPG